MHNDDGFGALDLKSTRGTYVNGSRLVPHQWRVLGNGDEIRFGKVAFTVSMKQPTFAGVGESSETSEDSVSDADAAATDAPESWQNLDVAEFLESEDEDDFELPDGRVNKGEKVNGDNTIGEAADEFDFDDKSEIEKDVELDTAPKKRPPRKKIDHSEYKRRPKKTLALPRFGLSIGDAANWKTIGAIALVALTIGLFAHQIYSFGRGPAVPIRANLD